MAAARDFQENGKRLFLKRFCNREGGAIFRAALLRQSPLACGLPQTLSVATNSDAILNEPIFFMTRSRQGCFNNMRNEVLRSLWLPLTVVIFLTACGESKKGESVPMATHSVSADEWPAIAKKRIVFGHQSVGANILSGVQYLAKEAGVQLKVTESRYAMKDTGITHFSIGRNGDPLSKINDFANIIKSGLNPDIALMKLCYVDITSSTDAKKLAQNYISSLERLNRQFPQTIFVAVTTPLTTVQSGPKAWIKKLLGRSNGLTENFRRQEFNNILRSSYGSKGRLFDLAQAEAKGADNYTYEEQPVEVLNPVITSDGGHLNDRGAQSIAAALLKFIVGLPART